ncbi:methyl-CpG-binding domain protein 1 isoform X16 [Rhineura floridana]|uniref:methyl-CpG-binding domain protein 1 isoform X16 n=1 Tax=Rhineura floridana TaxID=261503 RepID=UPI002AC85CE7|nr:methyl-CpG-binding domain protein 1 isoform X16 [Rhineura floridana]
MTEGWVDCPSLGPGWQRREVLRKNGTRPGQSDTYYISPRGERIRSRVELTRLLGCSRDLADFDFKKGIFVEPNAEPPPPPPLPPAGGGYQKVKKGSKRHLPPLAAATPPPKKPPDLQVFEEPPDQELPDQKPPKLELELPIQPPTSFLTQQQELLLSVDQPPSKPRKRRYRKHLPPVLASGKMEDVTVQETNLEESIVCCASCQGQFPGVMLPSQRRCRWLCPDCRAQRRDFNREQRYYKKWKHTMERDPGGIPVVRRRKKQLGAVKERKNAGRPPKHPTTNLKNSVRSPARRRNRKCGKCEACLLKTDCGRCDFCCDKPKFGGRNLKRQKCRWRQCLQFAMKRLLPEEWSSPEGAAGWKVKRRRSAFGGRSRKPTRIKQVGRQGAKGSGQKRQAKASFQPEESPSSSELVHLPTLQGPEESEQQQLVKWKNEPEVGGSILAKDFVKDRPTLPHVKEESDVPTHSTSPTRVLVKESDTRLPAVNLLIAASPKVKQEHAEPGGDRRPSNDSPISAGLPQFKRGWGAQVREVVVLDDEDDDEVEQLQQMRPPVIMEIYSLGGVQPLAQLDSVLREFLAELNEIPLPAHWEVLSPLGGPDLRLVQRSEHSTMSAAVIHIRPGLFFHVVVRDLPVPPEHKLYASHPARLTTVDEVVELICDLEAYRLCSGWPAGWHAGERSEACDVLVYSGCCPQCRLNPWPSGSGVC